MPNEAPPRRRNTDGRGVRAWILAAAFGCALFVSLFVLVFVAVVTWWLGTHTWQWPGTGG
ncbi:hypothetical protein AB0F77_37745 [Streptomyces sp. NPDC026672]|uniref:hypothetical protein n=1 Tax=unclassified Streptomyces TaxID=2593676 RepID=UPI0033D0094E